MFRSNISEGQVGIPLLLKIKITDTDCEPVVDAFVDIWHCNSTGFYSGFTCKSKGCSSHTSAVQPHHLHLLMNSIRHQCPTTAFVQLWLNPLSSATLRPAQALSSFCTSNGTAIPRVLQCMAVVEMGMCMFQLELTLSCMSLQDIEICCCRPPETKQALHDITSTCRLTWVHAHQLGNL